MKKPKPKATAWTEQTVYVECPECEHVECFGEGIIVNDDSWTCEKCGETFEIDDCTK